LSDARVSIIIYKEIQEKRLKVKSQEYIYLQVFIISFI